MAAWKSKEVETFDYKVNFLLLYLCPVHLVNAFSSINSEEGRPVLGWGGTGTPSMLPLGIICSLPYFPAFFRVAREKSLLGKDKEISFETGFIWSMGMFSVPSTGMALEQADCMERMLELKAPHSGCSWRQWGCTWLKMGRIGWYYSGLKCRSKKRQLEEEKNHLRQGSV